MSEAPSLDVLIATAERLVEAVNFDVCGVHGKGGNGGLTSTETVRACDEMRLVLAKLKGARTQ